MHSLYVSCYITLSFVKREKIFNFHYFVTRYAQVECNLEKHKDEDIVQWNSC